MRGLPRTFFVGDHMFESYDKEGFIRPEEYKQALYWLRHPDEYPGDYQEFTRQVLEISTTINDHRDPKNDNHN